MCTFITFLLCKLQIVEEQKRGGVARLQRGVYIKVLPSVRRFCNIPFLTRRRKGESGIGASLRAARFGFSGRWNCRAVKYSFRVIAILSVFSIKKWIERNRERMDGDRHIDMCVYICIRMYIYT